MLQARVADANGVGTASAYVASGQVDDPNTASTSTGDLTATRHYTFAGSTVAVRTNDGKLSLMLGDEQGSVSVTMPLSVDTATGVVSPATVTDALAATRTAYTPYGVLRGDDNLALDRGWLGQTEDRIEGTGASSTGTGLTYLNARYYDPVLSRFLSPDPLMNPGDPKTLDPYRYADNNPVVFTDASGLFVPKLVNPVMFFGYEGSKIREEYTKSNKSAPNGVQILTPAQILAELAGLDQLHSGGSVNGTPSCDWLCVGQRNAEYQNIVEFWSPSGGGGSKQDQKPVDHSVNGPEGIPGPSWSDFWRGLRFFKNAGFLADPLGSAYGWGVYGLAKAGGADCGYYSQEAMMVCAGAPSWLHGRGGTMHSFVYVTSEGAPPGSSESDLSFVVADTRTLAHEAKHMDQFAIFGAVPFGLLYADANLQEANLTILNGKSHPAECNVFERWAGFTDGGYASCAAG